MPWKERREIKGTGVKLFYALKNISTLTHFFRPSKEIFFALMTYGQHGHGLAILDFKQRYITVCAKADNQLAQQGVFRRCLAATEWKGKQSGTDHGLPERHEENAEKLAVKLFPLNNQIAD